MILRDTADERLRGAEPATRCVAVFYTLVASSTTEIHYIVVFSIIEPRTQKLGLQTITGR